jgi:transketolase
VLTRQALPTLDRTSSADGKGLAPASGLSRGAYVLRDPREGAQVSLLASGSEVSVALAAGDLLTKQGVRARVVSFPCWSFFERLGEAEREEVLGRGLPRVAVEAAASLGWHRWVGARGAIVSIDRFGASAPGAKVLQEYGITPEHVAAEALRLLGARS